MKRRFAGRAVVTAVCACLLTAPAAVGHPMDTNVSDDNWLSASLAAFKRVN